MASYGGGSHETTSEGVEPPEKITLEHLRQITAELGLVTLCWPEIRYPFFEGRSQFPESYYSNNNKERMLLLYAENFRRQFAFVCKNRRPIILACDNECGIQKMVCTTLRPTTLPYKELYSWEGCACVVADHVMFEPLPKPILLPPRIISPSAVLERQSGHSYEMATLLVSLLLGAGFNAFVCSGYATQDVASDIMVRTECPDQLATVEEEEEVVVEDLKYKIRPPNDLRSKFLMRMEQQELERGNADFKRAEEKRLAQIRELEAPPFDELYGLRCHAWAVILPGRRGITEPFFIEPSTGMKHTIDYAEYLGVESIWNNVNYWINMQDCSNGLADIRWDLKVIEDWEHLLMGEPFYSRKRMGPKPETSEFEEWEPNYNFEEKHIDMPAPWSEPIKLTFDAYERRYPGGSKTIYYKKCLIELYAPYIHADGLLKRATQFNDYDYCDPLMIYEFYANRTDCLEKLEKNLQTELISNFFRRGREDACKEHHYYMSENTVEGTRTLKYYAICRADGLALIEMTPTTFREDFEGREDFLFHRNVTFAPRGHPPPGMTEGQKRIPINVLEKYERDLSKKAYQDIASLEFAILDNEIRLIYQYAAGKITASTRDFIKPPLTETGDRLTFNPNKSSGYMSEPGIKEPRHLQLLEILSEVLNRETNSLYHIRMAEDELSGFLLQRSIEAAVPHLTVKLFHPERNVAWREGMLLREKQQREQSKREVDVDVDFLSPYLARLGQPPVLTVEQAKLVRDWCLEDFKRMLLTRANDIQKQFEKETAVLGERQLWFESIQDNLTRAEEEEYFASISGQTFLLHCYELRLDRHKELSPIRYMSMSDCLRADRRLSNAYR